MNELPGPENPVSGNCWKCAAENGETQTRRGFELCGRHRIETYSYDGFMEAMERAEYSDPRNGASAVAEWLRALTFGLAALLPDPGAASGEGEDGERTIADAVHGFSATTNPPAEPPGVVLSAEAAAHIRDALTILENAHYPSAEGQEHSPDAFLVMDGLRTLLDRKGADQTL